MAVLNEDVDEDNVEVTIDTTPHQQSAYLKSQGIPEQFCSILKGK